MGVSITILGGPAGLKDWTGSVPESLQDITLRRFIEYHNTVVPMTPASMTELSAIEQEIAEVRANKKKSFKLREQQEKALRDKYNDMLKAIPEVVIKPEWLPHSEREIQFWSGFPDEYKGLIALEDLMALRTLINNLVAKYQPKKDMVSFKFKETTWFLPPAEMNGSTLIEFVESAQYEHNYKRIMDSSSMEVDGVGLKITSRWNALLPVVCILCRKEDERNVVKWYARNNEKTPGQFFDDLIEERSEMFAELPMSTALDVFFSFSTSRVGYMIRLARRSGSSARKIQPPERKT